LIFPAPDEVIRLSREYSLIPVCLEIPTPDENPVSLYAGVSSRRGSFLLERPRYAWIGERPAKMLAHVHDRLLLKEESGRRVRLPGADPFAWLSRELERNQTPALPGLPPLLGGVAGVFCYETVRLLEPNRPVVKTSLSEPMIRLMWFDRLIVFDRLKQTSVFVQHLQVPEGASETEIRMRYEKTVRDLRAWAGNRLGRVVSLPPLADSAMKERKSESFSGWAADLGNREFARLVVQAKQRIASGDIFQVVLSRSWTRRTSARPLDVYRSLAALNPAPYLFLIDLGEEALVGASPETLVRVSGGTAEVHPIAGTRPRGRTAEEDQLLLRELLTDEKENAEHYMLVDLARNDLGRVAIPGTVRVVGWKEVEPYSQVMHLVSRVEARLKKRFGAVETFRACFPAGTVTGAPKVKAMEIIAGFEPTARGFYAGAGAFFGFSGDMDSWITIRTARFCGQTVQIRAGAGIVADSDPFREAEEAENKAAALVRAIELAETIHVTEGSA
jgi:anthranilate synthase component 1